MTDNAKTRGGCLWWFVLMTTMLAGCVGSAAVIESLGRQCYENRFSRECAARVLDDLTSDRPRPSRPAD